MDRVAKDIKGNLAAVRDYAETLSQNAVVVESSQAFPIVPTTTAGGANTPPPQPSSAAR